MPKYWPPLRFRLLFFRQKGPWWRAAKRPFVRSLMAALRGVLYAFITERSFRWQCLMAFLALILSWLLKLSMAEWITVVLTLMIVLIAEITNTAIEISVDLTTRKQRPRAQAIKDIAAGGALIASCGAAVIGAIIFLPKILAVFSLWYY